MISISHWGMFQFKPQLWLCTGYKLADGAMTDRYEPGALVQMIPLTRGEKQPIYSSGPLN
jgi:hypothetical protein